VGPRLPLFATLRVVRAMADALLYMHGLARSDGRALELVHGDVSPSNILLSVDGRIKLADFGVAAVGEDTGAPMAGKVAYLPGEAMRGGSRAQGWDLFALGAVLYEALSGQRAFPGGTIEEINASLADGARPLDPPPGCPPALARLAERMVARDPAERPRTARAVLDELHRAAPPSPDERDQYRAFLAALFAEPDFVDQHGELPSTTGLPSRVMQAGETDATEQITVGPRRVARALRFGLSSAHGSERARASGLRFGERLGSALGRPVRTVVLADYQTLVDTVVEGDVDFAWMPPLSFVEAFDRGAGLLAVARRAGQKSYRGAIIVRADASFTALAELGGARGAFVDPQSSSGYLMPMAQLVRFLPAGGPPIKPQFHGSHRAVCDAVASGWAEFGATYAVFDGGGNLKSSAWRELLPERQAEVRALAFSAPIPGDCLACGPGLPESVADKLRAALWAMASEPGGAEVVGQVFGADGLVPGDATDYDALRAARTLVG
jgi:phosphate/phosphite/phosphonate ABC transporter binding protein